MDLWYSEKHGEFAKFSIKVEKHLYGGHSGYQRIDVFESYEFGRFLTLDGVMMLTQKDEFVYHEMMVHVPMAVNPDMRRVLVIGAGDGGIVRELAKYKGIAEIDLVEIDPQVIEVCKEYLPYTAKGFEDERLRVYNQDGLKFIRKVKREYDLIIVDSTDPFGPGEGLFTREFYGNCFNALGDDGIMVNQLGSPFYADDAAAMKRAYDKLLVTFPICHAYMANVPTYPSGLWLFGYAAKGLEPVPGIGSGTGLGTMPGAESGFAGDFGKWEKLCISTKYYNSRLHIGCFALPNYIKELLDEKKS